MYGKRKWTISAPLSIKLVSTAICKIVMEMCVVVSPQSYAVRNRLRVRQQRTIKSQLLLSALVIISLYYYFATAEVQNNRIQFGHQSHSRTVLSVVT